MDTTIYPGNHGIQNFVIFYGINEKCKYYLEYSY